MTEFALQMRYREFVRRTNRVESSETVREFLHLEILRILSALNMPDLVLHGGCKTRYIDGFPRYSMDMDFSINNFKQLPHDQQEAVIRRTLSPILRELNHLGIPLTHIRDRWHRGDSGVKVCFKANTLKSVFPRLFADHPGDINFNIDLDSLLPGEKAQTASLIADPSVQLLVLTDATHMARKAAAVLLRKQLRDLYDLDMYITRGTHYDLAVASTRLQMPALTHTELVERLCKRVDELDIKQRIHQVHLPDEPSRIAFGDPLARIANIKRMLPL